MPRSVWTGTLSFGLVSIPVSLFPATESKDVRFHLFDRQGRRVRYRRVVEESPHPLAEPTQGDEVEDEPTEHPLAEPVEHDEDDDTERATSAETEVAYEDLVRGFEVEPDSFVFLERGTSSAPDRRGATRSTSSISWSSTTSIPSSSRRRTTWFRRPAPRSRTPCSSRRSAKRLE
jgi:hypothetical protein